MLVVENDPKDGDQKMTMYQFIAALMAVCLLSISLSMLRFFPGKTHSNMYLSMPILILMSILSLLSLSLSLSDIDLVTGKPVDDEDDARQTVWH